MQAACHPQTTRPSDRFVQNTIMSSKGREIILGARLYGVGKDSFPNNKGL
jgi:hypothetical protein